MEIGGLSNRIGPPHHIYIVMLMLGCTVHPLNIGLEIRFLNAIQQSNLSHNLLPYPTSTSCYMVFVLFFCLKEKKMEALEI